MDGEVSLMLPAGLGDMAGHPAPRYVLAAAEVASRYTDPGAIEGLACAFEAPHRN
jgi:hypothetical protein